MLIALFISFLCISQEVRAQSKKEIDAIYRIVEQYCKFDTMGGVYDSLVKIVRFSSAWQKREEESEPGMIEGITYWQPDSLFIVDSYEFTQPKKKKEGFEIEIVYKRLARKDGCCNVQLDYKKYDTVSVNLILEN